MCEVNVPSYDEVYESALRLWHIRQSHEVPSGVAHDDDMPSNRHTQVDMYGAIDRSRRGGLGSND